VPFPQDGLRLLVRLLLPGWLPVALLAVGLLLPVPRLLVALLAVLSISRGLRLPGGILLAARPLRLPVGERILLWRPRAVLRVALAVALLRVLRWPVVIFWVRHFLFPPRTSGKRGLRLTGSL